MKKIDTETSQESQPEQFADTKKGVASPWIKDLTKEKIEELAEIMDCYRKLYNFALDKLNIKNLGCGKQGVDTIFPYTGSSRSDSFVIDDEYWGTCSKCDEDGFYYLSRTDLTNCFCEICNNFVNKVTGEKCPFGHSIWSKDLNSLITWDIKKHKFFPNSFKKVAQSILILSLKDKDGKPKYPQTYFHALPKPIILIIIEFLSTTLNFQLHSSFIRNFIPDIRMVAPSRKVIDYWRTVKLNKELWREN